MKKIILMGRSECGKTTLTQALKGDVIHYHKTQYINHYDVVIDTPRTALWPKPVVNVPVVSVAAA